MRKKKRPTLASPDLTAAWANFYESTKEADLEAYAKQGWKTLDRIVEESGQPLPTMTSRIKKLVHLKAFEKKIVRGMTRNGIREVALYRPMPTKCQQRANNNANP